MTQRIPTHRPYLACPTSDSISFSGASQSVSSFRATPNSNACDERCLVSQDISHRSRSTWLIYLGWHPRCGVGTRRGVKYRKTNWVKGLATVLSSRERYRSALAQSSQSNSRMIEENIMSSEDGTPIQNPLMGVHTYVRKDGVDFIRGGNSLFTYFSGLLIEKRGPALV